MKTKGLSIMALLLIASMVLTACGTTAVETVIVEIEGETVVVTVTPEIPYEPVVLQWNWNSEPPTADPSLATDTTSLDLDSNLFMGLTHIEDDGSSTPWLAESWDVSTDGLTWTFHLRDDIPWVRYNCQTGGVEFEYDADGNQRFVNAYDVEYGSKRTIDPATASDYAYVQYIIKNGQAVNDGEEGFTLDDIGVTAIDATTVQYDLEFAAGFFPAIAGMWTNYALPSWTIEAAHEKWTEPCTIVTNGPYVMTEWVHGATLNLMKNPHWPDADTVQIDEVHGVMINEASTAFAMYENGELYTTGVPLDDMDRVKADPVLSEELYIAPRSCTYYYGFTNNKAPFDDVRMRMAFSMSVDKQSLIDNVLKGGQVPAGQFAPNGIFGAPVYGTVGLPYDPAGAKALMDEYLAEKGMTVDDLEVVLMHNTSEGHAKIAAAIQQMWVDNLGVDMETQNQEWKVYLQTIKNTTPLDEMPHIWRLGWCADYADENNWVYEVFNSDAGANRLRRGCVDDVCTEVAALAFDDLTEAAKSEPDPAKRVEMYLEAEKLLSEVEAAYIPIYHYTRVNVTKPFLTRLYPSVGHAEFAFWSIDTSAMP